jgi:hypothetical protein
MKFILTRIADLSAEVKWHLVYGKKYKTLIDLRGRSGLLIISIDRQN